MTDEPKEHEWKTKWAQMRVAGDKLREEAMAGNREITDWPKYLEGEKLLMGSYQFLKVKTA